jgi:hypothetical protein
MKTLSAAAILLGAVALFGSLRATAQEIDATVTANTSQLSPSIRDEVAGFAEEMQRYINSTRWTDIEWEGEKVKMNFSVVFTGGSPGGGYGAKLLVASQRNVFHSDKLTPVMMIFDGEWSFPYTRGQPFQRDPSRYDQLTGLIDFYVYLALGHDLDSYNYLAGTPMYQKAWDIAQRAQMRSDASGWSTNVDVGAYSRYNIVRELTDARFNPLRKYLYDYHYNGLDLMADNRAAALDSLNKHLTSLVLAKDKLVQPSTLMRVWNEAKYTEYADLFAGYSDKQVWRKLLYLDPGHQVQYEAAQKK